MVFAPYGDSVFTIVQGKKAAAAPAGGKPAAPGQAEKPAAPAEERPAAPAEEKKPVAEEPPKPAPAPGDGAAPAAGGGQHPALVAQQKFVRLGERRGDFVEVVSGLAPGELVVSNGAFKLRSGAPLAVNDELAPPRLARPQAVRPVTATPGTTP